MKKRLIMIMTLLSVVVYADKHPFYVSVTQIDYKEKSLQITLKIFVEDLESALIDQGKPKLNLGEKMEASNSEKIIKGYLNSSFSIKINDIKKEINYVGKEVEDDVIWIYLEIKDIRQINSIEVFNSIITEKYEGQTNLVHTTINGEKKSLILNKRNPMDKISY